MKLLSYLLTMLILVSTSMIAGCLDEEAKSDDISDNLGKMAPLISSYSFNGLEWKLFDISENFSDEREEWFLIQYTDVSPNCGPCNSTIDGMREWSNTYESHIYWDITFIALASNITDDSNRTDIEQFRESNNHTFLYVDDLNNSHIDDATVNFNIPGVPTFFLVQPDGVIAWQQVGTNPQDFEYWDASNQSVNSEELTDQNGDDLIDIADSIEYILPKYDNQSSE